MFGNLCFMGFVMFDFDFIFGSVIESFWKSGRAKLWNAICEGKAAHWMGGGRGAEAVRFWCSAWMAIAKLL